jgi:hypothetical protein
VGIRLLRVVEGSDLIDPHLDLRQEFSVWCLGVESTLDTRSVECRVSSVECRGFGVWGLGFGVE